MSSGKDADPEQPYLQPTPTVGPRLRSQSPVANINCST